jgi:hypothetical protein
MSAETCDCHSYNGDFGEKPEVPLDPPSWSDRTQPIMVDACIAHVVQHLWNQGVVTLSSCCGHGKRPPSVVLSGDPWSPIEVQQTIADVDGRAWDVYQWQLVQLGESDSGWQGNR